MKSSSTHYSGSFKETEEKVSDDPGSYKGIDPEALCTRPEDILSILSDPLVTGTWVDLGSGYGHTVMTYAEKFPDRKSVGVEKEEPRNEWAKALAREKELTCDFIQGDLLTDDIPEGNTYFLYFPQGHVLDRILSFLSQRPVTLVVIESHGDLFPRLEKEAWLKLEREIPLSSKRHNPLARIYRSTGEGKLHGLHQYSFEEKFILFRDATGLWWGDSFGLCAQGDDYLLAHPPRTVKDSDVVKIMTKSELPPLVSFLISLRKLPDVSVTARGKVFHGPIRKILETPAFSVEFPGGERLQWSDIGRITQGSYLCYDSSSPSFSLPPVL